jgi:CubicO group peptidase (beta-lactamase class C family)
MYYDVEETAMSRSEHWHQRLALDLSRLATECEVPGASVAVLIDGHVIEATAGVVNLHTGVAVTPDSLFQIQSVTKVWTATLVLQLIDDGLVELDAPVQTYLPTFRTADESASEQITVRHLLTHTGGFEGDLWAPTTVGDDALQRFVEDLVSHADQRTQPGTLYSYCSAGMGVLGHLVEVLRGTTYEVALRHHLADPLGTHELAFSADQALRYRTAIGHGRPTPAATQQPLKAWAPMPPSNPAAGNQLAMSARALLALGRLHVDDGSAVDGTQVLSSAAVQMMQHRYVDHPAATGASWGHGLGWFLSNQPGLVEHGGGAIGVASLLRLVPERGVAIAVLTNGGHAGRMINALVDPLLYDVAGVEPAAPLPTPPPPARVAEPDRYVGRYRTRVFDNEVSQDDGGRLWLTAASRNEMVTMAETAGVINESQRHELRPLRADTFLLLDHSGTAVKAVEFIGATADKPAQFLHTGRAAPRIV